VTSVLLAGGRIIDPATGRDDLGDLLVQDGRVAAIGRPGGLAAERQAERTVGCAGRLVVPGFIDLHVHLREAPFSAPDAGPSASSPSTSSGQAGQAETIATGAAAAVAGGFTTICAMPNTQPPLDSAEAVAWYAQRGREVGLARVLPVGCMTRGRAGRAPADLAALRAAGAAAFSDDGADVADDAVFEEVLARAAKLGAVVSCHCEDPHLAAGGVINDGPIATALGLPGLPPEAEEMAVERACAAAARTGCRVHIAHVSTAGAVEIVSRAKAAGAPVTAEAAPHHFTLTDEALRSRDSVFKVNPPLRSGHDLDAVIRGLKDGTIDAIATDHAPHTAAAKVKRLAEAPPGMIGLESALAVSATALVETGLLAWPDLIRLFTAGPARVLGLDAGKIDIGDVADLAIIDPAASWLIDPERFASRARNCPFAGWQVRGRVVVTLVGGRVVYEEGSRFKVQGSR